MFTVIICDKSVIRACTKKYHTQLKPFLDSKEYAFCAWNPKGETLAEALPGLDGIISIRKEWRAVILADGRCGVLDHSACNPFDYAGYQKIDEKMCSKEQVLEYREYVKNSVDKAVSNPLMKLSIWLAGSAVKLRPEAPAIEFMSVEPCSDEYNKVREQYGCSVSDLELSLARAYRYDKVAEHFEIDGDVFNTPSIIITMAERSTNIDLVQAAYAWEEHTEFDYSNFIEDNMYSNKLRCLVYDLPRVKGKIKEADYFNYLSTVMTISLNEFNTDIVKFGRVYDLALDVNEERMSELCNQYLQKLHATLDKIARMKNLYQVESNREIDDAQAEEEFEEEVVVPVSIDREYDVGTLMCEYDDIGLSKDCPDDEERYWSSQHKDIRKRFNRFIRKPQRCIEKSVDIEFRNVAGIDAIKAKRLNKYQMADINIKLYEEEQSMLETHTSSLFNKALYDEKLDEADKNVRRGISNRMTRKTSIIVSIIPIIAFLIGFIPLFLRNNGRSASIPVSLLLTLISIAILIITALIMLFKFKKQIVNRFKDFNNVMSGIHGEINASLGKFSEYLSHAANVMREFAVVNAYEDKQNDMMKIYQKHEIDIRNNMRDIMRLFSDYIKDDQPVRYDVEPFKYDFDKVENYTYEIPYHEEWTKIEFLQKGNEISIPVDYIKRIRLRREDLYD